MNFYGGAEDDPLMFSFLSSWVTNPNYTELYIIQYKDGSTAIVQSSLATSMNVGCITFDTRNGNYYYPSGGSNSPVTGVGHTHTNSSEPTYPDDYTIPSGLKRFIYYQGAFRSY